MQINKIVAHHLQVRGHNPHHNISHSTDHAHTFKVYVGYLVVQDLVPVISHTCQTTLCLCEQGHSCGSLGNAIFIPFVKTNSARNNRHIAVKSFFHKKIHTKELEWSYCTQHWHQKYIKTLFSSETHSTHFSAQRNFRRKDGPIERGCILCAFIFPICCCKYYITVGGFCTLTS